MDEEIFRITPDKKRAKDLLEIAKDRISLIEYIPKTKAYKLIEDYYEIILELFTAVMYTDGCKTLSHIKVIEYIKERYSVLNEAQIRLVDDMRKIRHGAVYYGKTISQEFLINNEDEVNKIINIMITFVNEKL